MTDSLPALTGITASRQGCAGIITLDRHNVLNVLNLPMVESMLKVLTLWANDPEIQAVVVRSNHAKAFCAGGDIRAIRTASMEGRFDDIRTFFETEYKLVCLVGAYPKPYVALIDGYCMGGGMGISMHAAHRVLGEGAILAMPETRIGFFPDVGATHFLPRLPDGAGLYLGLSSAMINAADALAFKVSTDFVPRASHAELIESIGKGEAASDVIHRLATPAPGPSPLADARSELADIFASAPSALDIVQRLEKSGTTFARQTAEAIRSHSPTSIAVTFETLRHGLNLDLPEATALELFLSDPMSRSADFIEGVRTVLVDKDNNPHWNPARQEDVDPAVIAALFAGAPG